MTQTLLPAPAPRTIVDFVREDFADARAFVLTTCCTECGIDADTATSVLRECSSCGAQGCDCTLVPDAHSDRMVCIDCVQPCGCRTCADD